MTTQRKITVEVTNETNEVLEPILNDQIVKVIERVLDSENIDVDCEVSVLFVDNPRIQALNSEYRHKDVETDVLSFPQYDSIKDDGFMEDYLYLGDIVISLEKARAQAHDFGHTFERELLYLIVHSVLHLLGYDHMVDEAKGEMRQKEKEIFKQIEVFKTSN
ncbi:rRNA maturation RNase YbeY [Fusibacter ferrireducens]|uniref:Endoribonuclease YbeY n=1 Tax=Fusibacter ferrireducens TaxID=2785058 RepID=A0ABR9ZY82_9FIRM|nr:rRNA maturation RNase YbeY [Fusibacter ferrireducens]MBF4694921.1 rRNA maturation RNase YbeY [Fusibacter ferrireducens]